MVGLVVSAGVAQFLDHGIAASTIDLIRQPAVPVADLQYLALCALWRVSLSSPAAAHPQLFMEKVCVCVIACSSTSRLAHSRAGKRSLRRFESLLQMCMRLRALGAILSAIKCPQAISFSVCIPFQALFPFIAGVFTRGRFPNRFAHRWCVFTCCVCSCRSCFLL